MTGRSMKTFEIASVILIVVVALLDPWLPIVLAALILLMLAFGEVRRDRTAHAKPAKRA
jgi:hypothetical protein